MQSPAQTAKFRDIARERAEESRARSSMPSARQGETLETFAKDSTYSEPWSAPSPTRQPAWLNQTIDETAWARSGAHAVWVYQPDRTLLYSANLLYADNLHDLPLPPAAFDALEHQRYMHFFLRVPQGVMEICAATVHPSIDSWRQTPPQGFFFAGQLWSTASTASSATSRAARATPCSLLPGVPACPRATTDDAADGHHILYRTLDGWDGQPVACAAGAQRVGHRQGAQPRQRACSSRCSWRSRLPAVLVLGGRCCVGSAGRCGSSPRRSRPNTSRPSTSCAATGGEFGDLAELIQRVFRPAGKPARGDRRAQERPGSPAPERRTAPAGAEDGGRRAAGRRRGARLQ